MTHATHARTLKTILAATDELDPGESIGDWRLYDLAHDTVISYTYGLPRAITDAARVTQVMRTAQHPDLAVWEEISTTIIKERLA